MTENNSKPDNTFSFGDEIILGKYQNSIYKNIISDTLNGYKKIFLKVYDKYNSRFKKVYKNEMQIFFYYLKFLKIFNDEAEYIIKVVDNTRDNEEKKKLKSKKAFDDYIYKLKNSIVNAKVLLINDENDFNKQIKEIQKTNKGKLLFLGIDKQQVFEMIDIRLFIEADYFLSIANKQKLPGVYYPEADMVLYKYDELNKNINDKKERKKNIIEAIRIIRDEYYKADPYDTYYKTFYRHISEKEKQDKIFKEIDEAILRDLRELK